MLTDNSPLTSSCNDADFRTAKPCPCGSAARTTLGPGCDVGSCPFFSLRSKERIVPSSKFTLANAPSIALGRSEALGRQKNIRPANQPETGERDPGESRADNGLGMEEKLGTAPAVAHSSKPLVQAHAE